MTNWYGFDSVMTPGGWLSPGWIEIDDAGVIGRVGDAPPPDADAHRVGGHAIPGMPNLHSHAFQRAMAGLAERAGAGEDSFWTWREVMYRFVERVSPDHLEAIAAQLYVEMLKAGYTAVGEFHYLHHAPDGRPYDDPAEMSRRIIAAARRTGIALTLLPVLFGYGGFGARPSSEGQRRFLNDADGLLRIVQAARADTEGDATMRVGLAPHSLRAVTPETLSEVLAGFEGVDATAPVHIHAAEQEREVEDCVAWSGQRPVEWLLAHAPVGPRWCLVHATHMTATETEALARSGAVAGLCPTTEANLGDGLFPLATFAGAQGRFGVGSDSHVSVSPVEELRWLEYGQRLASRSRLVARLGDPSVGAGLYRAALAGGARALGQPAGALETGLRADIVVLDGDHPVLAGRRGDVLVDSYVFSGNASPVRDVIVAGKWVIWDGRHPLEAEISENYRAAVAALT